MAAVVRLLLSIRYRITLSGLEQLQGKSGVLVLPNHPALVDPVIISSYFWPMLHVRPLVLEPYYYLPGAFWVMKLIGAIPIPDLDAGTGVYKQKRVRAALTEIGAALRRGDNVLLYPAGRVMTSGWERVRGSSAVYQLLRDNPSLPVALVRTRGLYGSSFSKVFTGRSPDFFRTLLGKLKIVLSNLIFFVPKRRVEIRIELNPAGLPRTAELVQLNRWLEDWYNGPGEEKVSLVSTSAWREELPEVPERKVETVEAAEASQDVVAKVKTKLAELSGTDREKIGLDSRLGDDLGLDSLNIAELLIWLDQEFAAADVEVGDLGSVAAVVQAAAGRRPSGDKTPAELTAAPEAWTEKPRPAPSFSCEPTIPHAFLKKADELRRCVAAGDERLGVLNWRRLKLGVVALAEQLKAVSEDKIGVLLPASAGTALVVHALLLARKIPVMINWTAGSKNIEHALGAAHVSKIITSSVFLDRLETDVSFLEDKFVFTEQLRRLPFLRKLKAFVLSKLPAASLVSFYDLNNVSPDEPAVILFTSGSEAAPKGVPLTHRNLLSNIEGAMDVLSFKAEDVLLSFLPPFHSFGLAACVTLPLCVGLKVVYYPNPNESRKLAAACLRWSASVVVGTPTFLKGILQSGTADFFTSARVLITGAEKAPPVLFDTAAKLAPQAMVIEGYGITECAPIVTAVRPGEERIGVGKPLPGVSLLIVNPENLQPAAPGERGLILIAGENVFPGYLEGRPDPFVHVDGKRWYNSGDLGYLENGSLVIAGRLKRFVKIAGEMISLPAIEEALTERWPGEDDKPHLAVLAFENSDGSRPLLWLVMTASISLEEANETLRSKGFPYLVRFNGVSQVQEIPLLGTGKTDYQQLQASVRAELGR